MVDPVTVAKLWMVVKPFKRWKEARQRRKERRMPEKVSLTTPDGQTIEYTPPKIQARTSTKLAVGNGVVGAFPAVEVLQWVQSIEFQTPWLEAATNSDYFIYYGSLLISYVIVRLTKSPLVKQAL